MQILRNEAYLSYAAVTKGAAKRRYWTFCGTVNFEGFNLLNHIISNKKNLEHVLDNLKEGIIAHDLDRNIFFFNREAEEYNRV